MNGKKIFVGVVVALLGFLLLTSVFTAQNVGTPPNPSSTMTSQSSFPFEAGAVNYEQFAQHVIPANKAIKQLRVQSVSEVTTSSGKDVVTINGTVDQREPAALRYAFQVNHNDVVTDYIKIWNQAWSKDEGGKWVEIKADEMPYDVSTSTDFFRGFISTKNSPVKELTYDGKDELGHKFFMTIDLNQLLGENYEPLGFSETTFWLNDELEMLRQETMVESKTGSTSFLVNEQKDFNKDFKINPPVDVVSGGQEHTQDDDDE